MSWYNTTPNWGRKISVAVTAGSATKLLTPAPSAQRRLSRLAESRSTWRLETSYDFSVSRHWMSDRSTGGEPSPRWEDVQTMRDSLKGDAWS